MDKYGIAPGSDFMEQPVLVAGAVLQRPKIPATRSIPTFHAPMPKEPKVIGGGHAPATKPKMGAALRIFK